MKRLPENDFSKMWDDFRLNGSREALSLIYDEYFDFLYDFAFKYTSDTDLIEDCIQNIFNYLLQKRKSLNPVSNLRFYLLKSFRRELIKQLQKGKWTLLPGNMTDAPGQFCFNRAEDEMDVEERGRVIQLVHKSIRKLGPRQQEMLYLRFNQDLDYPEVAEMMSISVDSCYKSVYRSIRFIKDDIEKVIGSIPNILLWVYTGFRKN